MSVFLFDLGVVYYEIEVSGVHPLAQNNTNRENERPKVMTKSNNFSVLRVVALYDS